jgi:voltage-gated potassium channel
LGLSEILQGKINAQAMVHTDLKNKDSFIFYWDIWIALLATYLAIEVPYGLIVHYRPTGIILVLNLFVTAVFIADIFVRFRQPSPHHVHSQHAHKSPAEVYLKSWFALDVVSTIPFELFFWNNTNFVLCLVLSLLRVLKMFRVSSFQSTWEHRITLNHGIVRLLFFFYFLGLFMHWLACGWIHIRMEDANVHMLHTYILALYWCTTTVTTIGYGDIVPHQDRGVEIVYTMCAQLMGAGAFGYIIGNIATLLTNIDIVKTRHRERVDRVDNYMKSKKMPKRLQERVHHYYNYMWHTRKGYDDAEILAELPESFRYEFTLFLNKSIIEKVPMFKDADPSLLKEILYCLKPCLYAPGDAICSFGEIGDEMYFINKGAVEVLSKDGHHVYATIKEGGFFGEIALLLKQPRNATIRAVGYCDLYSLNKASFDRVISDYPAFEKHIQKMAQERMEKQQN